MPYFAQTTSCLRLALTLLLASGLQTAALCQTSPRVDEAAAAAAVRLYEKDPALVLPAPRRESVKGLPDSFIYELENKTCYKVHARTGKVYSVFYPRPERGPGAKGKLSPDQAEGIARKYVARHYADFPLSLTKTRVTDNGGGYTVRFQQQVAGTGAELPNYAYVAMDALTGAVVVATMVDWNPIPVEAADGPAVSQDEAVQIFVRAAGMVGVTELRTPQLRWIRRDGDRLIWTLMVHGIFPGEVHGVRGGAVDARTGSIISIGQPQTPDYRIAQGPHGPVSEPAQGPPVPAAGSLDAGGASSGSPPPAAAAGLGAAALAALAAGAIYLLRRRGRVSAQRRSGIALLK